MGRLLVFFALADVAVLVVALIDCLSTESGAIRALPRFVWVIIIIVFTPIGGVAWFFSGRPVAPTDELAPDESGEHVGRRTLAPDDDPEFLSALKTRSQQARDDRLAKWEADLRRREEELNRREHGVPNPDDPTTSA